MVAELRDRVEGLRPGPDALHSGYELYLFIASFAGEYMLHIADEELRANPALWKHYDDETLRETEGRLIGSIPPEEMAVWLRLMLPAMNAVERAGLLAGVRSTIPPEAFEGCLAIAREALDPRDWSRLEADLAAAAAA
jgi:hypothetical protein